MLTQSLTTESRNITSKSIQNNYFLGILIILFVFLSVINYWVNRLLCNYPDCSFSKPRSKGNITNLQFWNPGVIIALRKVSWDHSIIVLRIKWFSARTDTEPVKHTRWCTKVSFESHKSNDITRVQIPRRFPSQQRSKFSKIQTPFFVSLVSFFFTLSPCPGFHPVASCTSFKFYLIPFSHLSHFTWNYILCSYVPLFVFSPLAYSMRSSTWLFTIVTQAPNKYLLTQK